MGETKKLKETTGDWFMDVIPRKWFASEATGETRLWFCWSLIAFGVGMALGNVKVW